MELLLLDWIELSVPTSFPLPAHFTHSDPRPTPDTSLQTHQGSGHRSQQHSTDSYHSPGCRACLPDLPASFDVPLLITGLASDLLLTHQVPLWTLAPLAPLPIGKV